MTSQRQEAHAVGSDWAGPIQLPSPRLFSPHLSEQTLILYNKKDAGYMDMPLPWLVTLASNLTRLSLFPCL